MTPPDGFASAQAAHDNALPPEVPEPDLTHIDVTFTVRIGMDVDLANYYGAGSAVHPSAEAFVRRDIEGYMEVTGNIRGDERNPIPQEDIEIFDFNVEVDA